MDKSENIEIKRILDILNSKRILIILMLLISIALGYVYSYYCVVPAYKSTATLLLIPNNADNKSITNSDLTLNSGLISTYSNIAKNSKVLNQVINNLGLNMTEEQLLGKIKINIVKDTHIMEISVNDSNPQRATDITKELSNVFLNEIKQIYNLDNIGIVDEAQLPNMPYNINHIKDIGIFFIAGLIVSAIYIMVIYLFDNTIKKEEDIEKYIKIKSLGNIPINNINKKSEIVNRNDAKSYVTECINTIRTNILYMNSTKNAKTILITSCMPREGKSWVSANIAISFAETNKKVLLIDADMRKGRANKIFGLSNEQGLSNYLFNITGDVEKDVYLAKDYIKETKFPNLHILTNGTIPPNPSELLASNNMKELIAILKSVYDIIIIDAPPCKLVSDSIVLSTIVDSSVIVADSGNTKIPDLKEVKKSIDIVGGKIIGGIVNKVKIKGKLYSKRYYYGHTDSNNYRDENKTIVTIDELIERAIPKLEAKDFNLFLYENDLIETQEDEEFILQKINNTEIENVGNEEIQKFIDGQNKYLQKVINTVSDIKTQLNTSLMKDKLQAKKQNELLQVTISKKLDEIQQQSSALLKDEIQNINNEDDFNRISNEIGQVKSNYETILEQIKNINEKEESFYNNYPDEIDNIYNEIRDVKDNYKQIIEEIKENNESSTNELVKQIKENNENSTNELVKQLNEQRITREEMKEIFKEEMPNNSEEISNIYNEIKDVKDNYKQIIEELKENNENNTNELVKQLNEQRITREEMKEIFKEEIPNNSEEINNIYNEIKDVKDNYKQIIQEIKENNENNTNELIQQLNSKRLTGEEIKEILKEEVLNNIYTTDIEKIYDEVKEAKINYEKIIEEIQNIPNMDVIAEQLDKNNLTGEEIKRILKERISEMNYADDIENIYNKIEDTKINYTHTIEEIVDINNEKLMEVLKREERNKEQIQNLLNDKIEEMQEKNKVFLKEEISNIDYTEQINQMNEMISSLKDSYLELSNIIRSNNINTQQIENDDIILNEKEVENDDNIIDIKMLKKQKEQTKQKQKIKSYSINEDIPYSELEKTATCIIEIKNNKRESFSDESYESMM